MSRAGEPLLLGIDVGTASSKGVLATVSGEVVAVSERPHLVSRPRPGWFEHDAEEVWWADVVALTRELAARAGRALRGVCVSGIGPCVVPCDGALRPLRPAILYGVDTRAEAEVAELTERFGDEAILARCGSQLSSQALGPKLLWLARNERRLWDETRGWYMASSFAVARLTGEYVLDHHSASQCDPLYDLTTGDWAYDWAPEICPGVELPRLVWPGEQVGTVTAAAAARTGLPEGLPVAAGTIDAWAEAFSVGVRRPGDLMLMYGSTMFFVQVAAASPRAAGLWSTAGVEPGAPTLAAGMSTSGSLTDWLRSLSGTPFAALAREASEVPAGARGLLVLPYFAGERSPLFDPHARGVVAGLTLDHGRAELARAIYEAIGYGVRHNLEAFAAAGAPGRRVVAVGGGTKNGLWTQVVSSIAGVAQEVPRVTTGAAYGDALLAGIAAGLVAPESDWTVADATVEPAPADAAVYERLYADYLELYPATAGIVHRLAALQEQPQPQS